MNRTITRVQGERYMYEAVCLNCGWTHFQITRTGGRDKAAHGPSNAYGEHVRATGHKVKLTRTWVIAPINQDNDAQESTA